MRATLPVRRKRNSQSFTLEALEPRVLFSADAASLIGELVADDLREELGSNAALIQTAQHSAATSQPADAQSNAVELIVIDNSVEDAAWIAEQLRAENKPNRVITFLDSDSGGIEQISDTLSRYDTVSALHIFSHAEDAELLLGNQQIGITELMVNAQQISGWASSLTDGADILLYGCDLASSANGVEFATLLGQLTQADIAASDNLTSGNKAGGDWTLEHRTGTIEADAQLAGRMLSDFEGSLATFTVTSLDDNDSTGTLRWAITQANESEATVDAHIIDFTVAGTYTVLTTALPEIKVKVDIDATTAPGYLVDVAPVVIIDGSALADVSGLQLLDGSDGSSVKGLDIRNFTRDTSTAQIAGLLINSDDNTILANDIGTGGANYHGIRLVGASNNTIGDATDAGRNVVSGNEGQGIRVQGGDSENNRILGNYIGLMLAAKMR